MLPASSNLPAKFWALPACENFQSKRPSLPNDKSTFPSAGLGAVQRPSMSARDRRSARVRRRSRRGRGGALLVVGAAQKRQHLPRNAVAGHEVQDILILLGRLFRMGGRHVLVGQHEVSVGHVRILAGRTFRVPELRLVDVFARIQVDHRRPIPTGTDRQHGVERGGRLFVIAHGEEREGHGTRAARRRPAFARGPRRAD